MIELLRFLQTKIAQLDPIGLSLRAVDERELLGRFWVVVDITWRRIEAFCPWEIDPALDEDLITLYISVMIANSSFVLFRSSLPFIFILISNTKDMSRAGML